jgi:hypothetical protein
MKVKNKQTNKKQEASEGSSRAGPKQNQICISERVPQHHGDRQEAGLNGTKGEASWVL